MTVDIASYSEAMAKGALNRLVYYWWFSIAAASLNALAMPSLPEKAGGYLITF